MSIAVNSGDRVQVRDRPWRVCRTREIGDALTALELEALDSEAPRSLSVVVPPDEATPLPAEDVQFRPDLLDSFASWRASHRLLAATLVRETGLLSGARFGRVALEAYQLAPVLRLLSKPRPRLLIADDVGLGKTIEAGLAILELLARGRITRTLIVAPPGLLLQWQEEMLEKFGLDFTVIDNDAGLARVQAELPAGTSPWDALPRVLTSIDFLKKKTIRNRALRKRWDLVVVDEAHSLAESGTPRNPYATQRTRLGRALRESSRGMLLLTATPHNGHAHSFRSLIELVEPSAATLEGDRERVVRRVQMAMIRRMKAQITRDDKAETPDPVFPRRAVTGVSVPVEPAERDLLHKVATYCSRTARSAAKGEDADLVTFAMQIIKKRALSSRFAFERTIQNRLSALRKAEEREAPPTHAEIRDLQADLPLGEAAAERTAARILRSAIPKEEKQRKAEMRALNGIRRAFKSLPEGDAKIRALLGELRGIFREDPLGKVIVFTEYLDTLQAIQTAIDEEPDLSGSTVVLRGGLSGRQRSLVQQRFETADVRLLLATDAASEGLNLQRFCHRIIHFELPWNPNRLEQRNGRVDRYGQTRPPDIRYLYYPDSPEDDVLHILIGKIENMQEDRVSTPDILGVLRGDGELEAGLLALDAAAPDAEAQKQRLVRLFDDRTADFVRDVQPLISGRGAVDDGAGLLEQLGSSTPLLADDVDLENLVRAAIGPSGFSATESEGIFRIEVPLRFRGPSVSPVYPRVTFRRSLAVQHKQAEVDFITPLHPLVRAMAADARRRLAQVYSGERGLPPRRLAARPVEREEPASVVFTFLGDIEGGRGMVEQELIAVRIGRDLEPIGTTEDALTWVTSTASGEASGAVLTELFAEPFDDMRERAAEIAARTLESRAAEVRTHRTRQAELLRADLDTDVADRLREIDDAERHARGLVEDDQQIRLFADADLRPAGFDSQRAATHSYAEERREEIRRFEQVCVSGERA